MNFGVYNTNNKSCDTNSILGVLLYQIRMDILMEELGKWGEGEVVV
jgi:hypothetical protein